MKIKYSALVSDVSGKLNGSVAARNLGGNYLRNKITPLNPQTAYQMARRGAFGSVAGLWRGLTFAQVTAWNGAAKEFPYTDQFGDTRYLSGFSLHQKLNTNLSLISRPALADPPVPMEIPQGEVLSVVFQNDTETFNVTAGFANEPIPGFVAIYATKGMPVGKSFVKNEYRLITIASSPTTGNFYDAFVLRFGVPPTGSIVHVKVAWINPDTGQRTPDYSGRGQVTA